MAKRSPFESYHKRQQAASSKYLDIWISQSHPCICGHPQGFHWNSDNGKSTGKCEPADCGCTAFSEDFFAAAQLAAGVLPATTAATADHDSTGDCDALSRVMRAEEQREVSAEEMWERALNSQRPHPMGKPRCDMLHDPAAMEVLRELGGSPEDLTG